MSHYSLAFRPDLLSEWANTTAKALKARYKRYPDRYPSFVYRGMSGIVSATALMLALNRGKKLPKMRMNYVRKEHERSHGNYMEVDYIWDCPASIWARTEQDVIFIDDFIDSGATFEAAMRAVYRYTHASYDSTTPVFILLTGMDDGENRTALKAIEKHDDNLIDLRDMLNNVVKEIKESVEDEES